MSMSSSQARSRILVLALLGLALTVPAAAAPVFVTATDSLDRGTTFENSSASQDVLLVRANGTNIFYVVAPGESATVRPDGVVEGSGDLDSFPAEVDASETGVAW